VLLDGLDAERLAEIRDLLDRLAAPRTTDEHDASALLDDAHAAIRDLLDDRDHLTRASSRLAEDLALWTGAL
jgi:hypothetical protein